MPVYDMSQSGSDIYMAHMFPEFHTDMTESVATRASKGVLGDTRTLTMLSMMTAVLRAIAARSRSPFTSSGTRIDRHGDSTACRGAPGSVWIQHRHVFRH